jgi:hypothetical protein
MDEWVDELVDNGWKDGWRNEFPPSFPRNQGCTSLQCFSHCFVSSPPQSCPEPCTRDVWFIFLAPHHHPAQRHPLARRQVPLLALMCAVVSTGVLLLRKLRCPGTSDILHLAVPREARILLAILTGTT